MIWAGGQDWGCGGGSLLHPGEQTCALGRKMNEVQLFSTAGSSNNIQFIRNPCAMRDQKSPLVNSFPGPILCTNRATLLTAQDIPNGHTSTSREDRPCLAVPGLFPPSVFFPKFPPCPHLLGMPSFLLCWIGRKGHLRPGRREEGVRGEPQRTSIFWLGLQVEYL